MCVYVFDNKESERELVIKVKSSSEQKWKQFWRKSVGCHGPGNQWVKLKGVKLKRTNGSTIPWGVDDTQTDGQMDKQTDRQQQESLFLLWRKKNGKGEKLERGNWKGGKLGWVCEQTFQMDRVRSSLPSLLHREHLSD